MKLKIIFIFCLSFSSLILSAQKNLQWGKKLEIGQKTGIYQTLEDLKNDKIVELEGKITNTTPDFFQVGKKYTMFKKADFAGYRDEFGNRIRIINGKGYIVLSYGKINLYSREYGFNTTGSDGSVERNPIDYNHTELFYSFSEDDEPVLLKGWDAKNNVKIASLLFKDNATVSNAYINDTSDDYDYSVKNAFTDNAERLIHYVDMYNGLVNE